MNDEQREEIIKGLNDNLRELNHLAYKENYDRITIENIIYNIKQSIKLIYEQENIIKTLLGDYGDSCDINTECGEHT